MYILTNIEKLFKYIYQNINDSYLWVVELWPNFPLFLKYFYVTFLQLAHYFYNHICNHICVHVYIYTYTLLFLKNKNLNTLLFGELSSIPSSISGRTPAITQGDQEHIDPWILLNFPQCHSEKRDHLSNITEQMSGSALEIEFSRLTAQARSPYSSCLTDSTTPGYSGLALYKWGTIRASRTWGICYEVNLNTEI